MNTSDQSGQLYIAPFISQHPAVTGSENNPNYPFSVQ